MESFEDLYPRVLNDDFGLTLSFFYGNVKFAFWAQLFKTNDIVSVVKISNVNISNKPIFFVKNVCSFCNSLIFSTKNFCVFGYKVVKHLTS